LPRRAAPFVLGRPSSNLTREVMMSATGLDVFNKSLQTTNIWLNEIMDEVGPDRQVAWKVLTVVLHRLRNRLPVHLAAHLGAQLPLVVRGVYYDQFQPEIQPDDCPDLEAFCGKVAEWLADIRPVNPRTAIHAVFKTLSRHIPEGTICKVQDALPATIRASWRNAAQDVEPPPAQGERGGYGGEARA
jgi:uncharacterized protein (DUF2267 family)